MLWVITDILRCRELYRINVKCGLVLKSEVSVHEFPHLKKTTGGWFGHFLVDKHEKNGDPPGDHTYVVNVLLVTMSTPPMTNATAPAPMRPVVPKRRTQRLSRHMN